MNNDARFYVLSGGDNGFKSPGVLGRVFW